MFCGQLPKLHGKVEGIVYINISISCSSCKKYACFALRHCDDVDGNGLATCTSTITWDTMPPKNVTRRKIGVDTLVSFCDGGREWLLKNVCFNVTS